MNERLSLFPMNRDLCAVARYATLLQGYKLAHLFAPGYMCMGGEDISRLDGGTHVGLPLTDYSMEMLRECDVLYMDYDETMVSEYFYKEIIVHAKEMGVEVILSNMLRQRLHDVFDNHLAADEMPLATAPENETLHELNVPVVMVLSHGLFTDQLAVELALRQHFTETGYNVGQIGSHDVCKLFGFTDIPDFMVRPGDVCEKAVRFNRYAIDLSIEQKAEIMIIGVPDAIIKYSDRLLQGLGALPFTVCNAVKSDVTIACTYYGDYKKMFFEELSQYGKYRLGGPIHFFNISNTSAMPDASIEQDAVRLIYTNLENSFVLNTLNNTDAEGYYLFNALDNDSVRNACVGIQKTLSGNAPYIR